MWMTAFLCKWHKHAGTNTESALSSKRETPTDNTHTQRHDHTQENVYTKVSYSGIMRIYNLTLHRLQKWNSSFSAACRLMDSSESVNSELNGASTCVTYADWACVCECMCECVCLYALPAVWVPLPTRSLGSANVPCLSLSLTRLLSQTGGWKQREDEGGRGRKKRGGRGLLTMPVSQGTRSVETAFLTNRLHPLCVVCWDHSTMAGVFFFTFHTWCNPLKQTALTWYTEVKYWSMNFRVLGFVGVCLKQVLQHHFSLSVSGRQLVKQDVDVTQTVHHSSWMSQAAPLLHTFGDYLRAGF